MGQKSRGVWLLLGVGGAVLTVTGVYFFVRSFQRQPSSQQVKKVQAIIKEAEALIKYHK